MEQGRTEAALELGLVSFAILFQELTFIRWLPSQVRVLAYFPNLILISAFLGIGVGCLLARRRSLPWLWPLLVAALVAVATLLGRVVFTHNAESEHLWLLYFDLPPGAPVVNGVQLPIVLAFVLSAATFVPLGQMLAARLNFFANLGSPLWGYALDIAGSLTGVIVFTLLGFSNAFPVVWFSLLLLCGSAFFRRRPDSLAAFLLSAGAIVSTVALFERSDHHSPYYAISVQHLQSDTPGQNLVVMTNGSYHQNALPLGRDDPVSSEWQRRAREGYHLPYRQLKTPPGRVLVLGAGTGNDVAVLLDEGAEEIDAVEIDPVILEIGRRYHPDRPYASERVHTIVGDARWFLSHCRKKYQLIVFGTLDSMTRLSALSNVRLDNFVYTLEGARAARECLEPDGGVVLYFTVKHNYIHNHMLGILGAAFAQVPLVAGGNYSLFNRIYLAGPAFAHLKPEDATVEEKFLAEELPALEIPTDDWPYLYLRSRGLGSFYSVLLGLLLLISVAAVMLSSADLRQRLRRLGQADLEMFLYGIAFLLIETKLVTSLNLVWGATWLTSSVVFGAILLMVLLATIVAKLKPFPFWVGALGLMLSLLATYAIPVHWLNSRDLPVRVGLCALFAGAPVFFASSCFALRFRMRQAADLAFGWNLLGAVLGGLLETLSMVIGLRALTLVAAAAYLLAFLLTRKNSSTAVAGIG